MQIQNNKDMKGKTSKTSTNLLYKYDYKIQHGIN